MRQEQLSTIFCGEVFIKCKYSRVCNNKYDSFQCILMATDKPENSIRNSTVFKKVHQNEHIYATTFEITQQIYRVP